MAPRTPKRLSPQDRRAEILTAAISLLGRSGLNGFSLEAAAREAKVALSLPRHYFGSYRGLLKAATADLLYQVEALMLDPELGLDLESRFAAYLDLLAQNPWGHHVWMRCEELHPEIATIVKRARRRMSEGMYNKPWRSLSKREQIDARGRIGYIEAIVSDWLQSPDVESKELLGLILQAIDPPGRKRLVSAQPKIQSKVAPRRPKAAKR